MAEITQLPNNCRAGKITVTPSNWNQKNANPNIVWRINFRFYDDKDGKSKQVRIKESKIKNLHNKQAAIKDLLNDIDEKLRSGYNFILKKQLGINIDFIAAQKAANNNMNIVDALEYAFKKLRCVKQYEDNVKYMKNYFIAVTKKQNMGHVLAKDFDEQYIKYILEECGKQKRLDRIEYDKMKDKKQKIVGEPWNNNRYNYWRALLNSLMIILEDDKIIPRVFTKSVKQLKKTETKRRVIDEDERKALKKAYKDELITYEMWRYIVTFSQAFRRHAEFMRLRREDIDLKRQMLNVYQMKGRHYKYVDVTITNNALRYWKELYEQAQPGQYIFSKGLRPGNTSINPKQIARRWNRLMKRKLGIEADSYTLKHWALDELAAIFQLEDAQKAAGHSSAKVTRLYTQGEEERMHQKLKKVNITL